MTVTANININPTPKVQEGGGVEAVLGKDREILAEGSDVAAMM